MTAPGAHRSVGGSASAVSAMLFTVVAVIFFIIPLGMGWLDHQLGSSFFAADNLLNAGILEWNRYALTHLRNPFDWPAGYPTRLSLAITENLLGWELIFAPLRALGFGIAASMNIAVIASFVVAGLGAERLSRQLGASAEASRLAGLIFAFSHYHTSLLFQFQSLSICWLPVALLALERFLVSARWRPLVGYAATMCLLWLSGMYYFIFAGVITLVWIAWRAHDHQVTEPRLEVRRGVVIVIVASVLMLPAILPYVQMARALPLSHPKSEEVARSLALVDFAKLPNWLALWGPGAVIGNPTSMGGFPGLLVLVLVTSAVVIGSRPAHNAISNRALVAMAVACAVLSLGPWLKIHDYRTSVLGGIPLPAQLLGWLPGIRVPSRWLSCSLVFLAPLAARGFDTLSSRWPATRPAVLFALASAVFLLESWPKPEKIRASRTLPDVGTPGSIYAALAHMSPAPVGELPTASVSLAYYSFAVAWHHHRTVAIDASMEPSPHDSLTEALATLPDADAETLLRSHNVSRLLLHRREMTQQAYDSTLARLLQAGYPVLYRGTDGIILGIGR